LPDELTNNVPNTLSEPSPVATVFIPETPQTCIKKRSRWNQSSPDTWKKNIPKKLRSMCQ